MLAIRSFVSPLARASARPQIARLPAYLQLSSLHSHVGATSTVSDVIIRDHKALKDCYHEIVNSKDQDHQDKYGNQFVWDLARHSVAEELIIYPSFEKYLGPEGERMAESDRKEHHRIKEHLKQFQNMKASHPSYIGKLKSLYAVLEHHIVEEERDDLPKFEEALRNHDGASAKLAASFERTKAFVPTRSHPSAGEHPGFESVMGLLTAPIDRLADMFRKFPDDK